jgi:membrane-bound lytic murein transglycosylase F
MKRFAWLAVCLSCSPQAPKQEPASKPVAENEIEAQSEYLSSGDLREIQDKGVLRFIVRSSGERMQRRSDPANAERAAAKKLAQKLEVKAAFIEQPDFNAMLACLEEGCGDVVIGSVTASDERAQKWAFSRPLRFVKQQLIGRSTDTAISKIEDMDGKTITVRESTSYLQTLKLLQTKLKNLKIELAPPDEDTYSLIQAVARGEKAYTVADNDILADALETESGVKGVLDLTDKDPIAWLMRKSNPALKNATDASLVEGALTAFKDDKYAADLDLIREKGVIRVITRNSSSTYFIYRGEQLGFDYELLRDFAKTQGLRLEIVVPPDRAQMASYLEEGRGDVVAAGLTITTDRAASFAFSAPYNTVSELLVVSAKDDVVKTIADTRGKKIAVRKSSSYFQTLERLKGEAGFLYEIVPEDIETEEIIDGVASGKYFATVADSNIAEIELTYSDKIRSVGPISEPRDTAWMLRQDQPKLRAELDAYLKKSYRGVFYNMTLAKYFKNAKQMRSAAGTERSDVEGQLSPYDAIAKKYARMYEFDWRLVTSQMYQESRFDPKAKSWVGALGLMQVMPQTAKDLKIVDVVDPDPGVHAGVKLMSRYAKMFSSPAVKEKDRIRFALAAYNCGPGHVIDARRVALDLKLNPNKWFGNVEKAMLMLSKPLHAKRARHGFCRCEEPVRYVSEIQTRYDAYSKLVGIE